MTDNPYAALQAESYEVKESLHTKSIRTVAIIYRILGGFLIANFGLGSLFTLDEISNLVIQYPPRGVPPPPILLPLLASVGVFLHFFCLASVGWQYVHIGSAMFNRQPLNYGAVIFLAYLMLLAFPLILQGAYNIVQLRRHWQAYCEALPAN